MSKSLKYTLFILVFIVAGIGAYSLGRVLRPTAPLAGTALQQAVDVNAVTLTHVEQPNVTLQDFNGKLSLVFFGFTNCPDVCPFVMSRLATIYRDMGEPDDVQVIMITVDPVNDTPEVVQRYAGAFHPDFIGLSGTNTEIADAAKQFFVGYASIGDKNFTHTDAVFVVDRQGNMRYIYNQDAIPSLETDLPELQKAL